MKLWLRYFREKKGTVFLYLLTVFLFLTVGSLYHIENLEKLSYAALLTLVFWVLAGLWNGWKYVRRSRRLEEVFRHFEQSRQAALGDGRREMAAGIGGEPGIRPGYVHGIRRAPGGRLRTT